MRTLAPQVLSAKLTAATEEGLSEAVRRLKASFEVSRVSQFRIADGGGFFCYVDAVLEVG